MSRDHHCIWSKARTNKCSVCPWSRKDHMQKLSWGTHNLTTNPGLRLSAVQNVENMQFVQPILHNLKGTVSRFFGICGRAMDGPQQVTFLGVLSRVAKTYVVADNAQQAREQARQRFTSGLSLTRRESRELIATVVLGVHLPLPFHFAALALCHVAILLYACDLQLPTVQWRAAGATYSFLALLVMELAEGGSTCALYCHSLLHTCGLSRLSVHTSQAGESNLRLSKRFARVTSTVPDDSIRACRTHELYMKLVHTSATRRQGRLWRPERRPIILEPCMFGAGTARREGMVHVLTLWMAIQQATLYMDDGTHSLKLGLQGVKGHSDICCVCGQCARALSHTQHWNPFDITGFQPWPLVPCTPNGVFLSSKERKKGAVDISSSSRKPPIASNALSSAGLHQKHNFVGDTETLFASAVWL